MKPKYRFFGNQRRYLFEDIINILEPNTCKKERHNILYSRVSSKGQENDLKYKKEILNQYSKKHNINIEVKNIIDC